MLRVQRLNPLLQLVHSSHSMVQLQSLACCMCSICQRSWYSIWTLQHQQQGLPQRQHWLL